MKKVKIVKEFFGIAAAKDQATWQRAKAKKDGRQIHKIEIVPAYELFKTNGWFKNNPFKRLGFQLLNSTWYSFILIQRYPLLRSKR